MTQNVEAKLNKWKHNHITTTAVQYLKPAAVNSQILQTDILMHNDKFRQSKDVDTT